MSAVKVGIVGATGETGQAIIHALLECPDQFQITALVRSSSIAKPATLELQQRDIKTVAIDLDGPEENMIQVLTGIDVVVSSLDPANLLRQIPLATAAKAAGVKRFVPCNFGTATPVGGILLLRDMKEEVINHIKSIDLPFTIIDVGWWFQLFIPRVPSGKADAAIVVPTNTIVGTGDVPSALTDLRDIGRYTALILMDPSTINKMVFAYGEVRTQKETIQLMERVSGEKLRTSHISKAFIRGSIERMKPHTWSPELSTLQYMLTWGIRGDNTPENAQKLGYIDAKSLYPDFQPRSLESFYKEVLDGRITKAYKGEYVADLALIRHKYNMTDPYSPSKSTSVFKIGTVIALKTITRIFGCRS